MKLRKLYPLAFLIGSVLLMLGVGVWNFVQARRYALRTHQEWADRVANRISANRFSMAESLKDLAGMSQNDVRRELIARPGFAGAYWFDVKTHEFERWVVPAFDRTLRVPDARLVVTQLRATQTQETQL